MSGDPRPLQETQQNKHPHEKVSRLFADSEAIRTSSGERYNSRRFDFLPPILYTGANFILQLDLGLG